MNLELKHVNKSFGDNKVLTDISFKVESGRAFGFLVEMEPEKLQL